MNKSLRDQRIWLTGASSGIGEACAYQLARLGARLLLTAPEEDRLRQVAAQCRALGASEAKILPFDLRQTGQIKALAETAWQQFDGLDIVHNNAGISQRAAAADLPMAAFQHIMDVNFTAPVIITTTLLPLMLKRGGGHWVVTTSLAGKFGFPLRSAYCASKHALHGFFETVQAEYFAQNIRVTLVCPGRVRTNISFHALDRHGAPHGKLDAGQARGLTAQQAAVKICAAIAGEKREVFIGGRDLLMVYAKRFFPALAVRLARKVAPL